VTAQDGAWNGRGYEYDRARFLEYTSDELVESFKDLKSRQLEALMALPCLFAYEVLNSAEI
jgi:adenine-specific DNA glycosylase